MEAMPKRHETDSQIREQVTDKLSVLPPNVLSGEEAPPEVEAAIANCDARELEHWVTIAVWRNPDGTMQPQVMHDGNLSDLEMKGYLHDAVWMTAHLQ